MISPIPTRLTATMLECEECVDSFIKTRISAVSVERESSAPPEPGSFASASAPPQLSKAEVDASQLGRGRWVSHPARPSSQESAQTQATQRSFGRETAGPSQCRSWSGGRVIEPGEAQQDPPSFVIGVAHIGSAACCEAGGSQGALQMSHRPLHQAEWAAVGSMAERGAEAGSQVGRQMADGR
jgi:hypothetical protein